MAVDPHCRIGRVRLKGSRSVAKNLPLKLIQTSRKLKEELASTIPLTDKQREGRAGQ